MVISATPTRLTIAMISNKLVLSPRDIGIGNLRVDFNIFGAKCNVEVEIETVICNNGQDY